MQATNRLQQAEMLLQQAKVLLQEEGDRALLVAAHQATMHRLYGDHISAQMWENVAEILLQMRADIQKKDNQALN